MSTVNTSLFEVVAFFQDQENYGAHDWDGKGECPQHWKFKGGEPVAIVGNLSADEALTYLDDKTYANTQVDTLVSSRAIECDDEYFRRSLTGWGIRFQGVTSAVEKAYNDYNQDTWSIVEALERKDAEQSLRIAQQVERANDEYYLSLECH